MSSIADHVRMNALAERLTALETRIRLLEEREAERMPEGRPGTLSLPTRKDVPRGPNAR